jgi:hypothetical protein
MAAPPKLKKIQFFGKLLIRSGKLRLKILIKGHRVAGADFFPGL